MKRVKRIILENLEDIFIAFKQVESLYLRIKGYQSYVVINISKDTLEQGKKRFLRIYVCCEALKSG